MQLQSDELPFWYHTRHLGWQETQSWRQWKTNRDRRNFTKVSHLVINGKKIMSSDGDSKFKVHGYLAGTKVMAGRVFELYEKFVSPTIPFCDFITDCWTIHNWRRICEEESSTLNCMYWKMGVLFIVLPSLAGAVFTLAYISWVSI